MINSVKATIKVSNEEVEVTISVNEQGNLVLEGVGSVTYEMFDDVLELSRYED